MPLAFIPPGGDELSFTLCASRCSTRHACPPAAQFTGSPPASLPGEDDTYKPTLNLFSRHTLSTQCSVFSAQLMAPHRTDTYSSDAEEEAMGSFVVFLTIRCIDDSNSLPGAGSDCGDQSPTMVSVELIYREHATHPYASHLNKFR